MGTYLAQRVKRRRRRKKKKEEEEEDVGILHIVVSTGNARNAPNRFLTVTFKSPHCQKVAMCRYYKVLRFNLLVTSK